MHGRAGTSRLALCIAAAIAAQCSVGLADARDWPPASRLQLPDEERVTVLPPSVSAERDERGLWKVTFTYRPQDRVGTVKLAGTFNSWNRDSMPMTGPDASGAYHRTLTLGPGEYRYKFVVDGEWTRDPQNPEIADDGYGNSVIHIGRVATLAESNGRLGDRNIEVIGLFHDPMRPQFFQPLAADRVLLRYRTFAHDVNRVWVALRDGSTTRMYRTLEGPLFAYWEARVTLPDSTKPPRDPGLRRVEYTFVLDDGGRKWCHPFEFSRTFREDAVFVTPDWARDAIWYQIMIDRFRNGDPSNDPNHTRPWTSAWFTPSPWEGADGETFYKWFVFSRSYGGDIAGVEEKLDYLRDLGVNAIYFNPVFEAPSHHKYNTRSYVHIDEHFGTKGDYAPAEAKEDLLDPGTWTWTQSDKRFLEFLKTAKAQGFHVIIDGVFNHVGDTHPAFLDVKAKGRESRFADWFDVTSWEPFKYNGWAGHGALPVFRKDQEHGIASRTAREHIFNITRRWMDPDGDGNPSDGIDGWRLDVPNEIPAVFWEEWRGLVKSINPDAYITGEIWQRADRWLDGRHFDAVMNYEFAKAAVAWIINREQKITASQIDRHLAEVRMAYPAQATHVLQNLIDSHDTDRVASMVINPDRKYDHKNRVQDNGPHYDNSKPSDQAYARARLIALLQMTYVGAPMIYYGDEAGMWGADDPTNRKPMLWEDLEPYANPQENHVMDAHLAWVRAVTNMRREHVALRRGEFLTLLTDDAQDVWAFGRYNDDERIVVVLTPAPQDREVIVPLPPGAPQTWKVVFRGGGAEAKLETDGGTHRAQNDRLTLTVPAIGGVVLRAAE